ncbi:CHAT domain-containing protein [Spirulina sp. CS-785/01]|uniref:CHAT domain-containing protein n=1 Tax=Spirulina sp. CS-785/01 TaxID=3021716 RepID=UPI00233003D8|nr:CHAT domain-containing protein [Spirulina sp. CS-785/01]MDB9315453.1 CHAT domain-containing protein [Spirulina sp. CS-785/01]
MSYSLQFPYCTIGILASGLTILCSNTTLSQPIPAQDGTGTTIQQNGQEYIIQGGTYSEDQVNLFHSFSQFGLDAGDVANFLSNSDVQNILGRVTGGQRSLINGQLQVTGSNANLYLMNPAGIIFGPNATLNINGDFFATTATGIGFNPDNWFNAVGDNNYSQLNGTPFQFAFDHSPVGAIVNTGELTVSPEQNVTLLGGNVVNTGTVTSPGGTITMASVPGSSLIELSQANTILSLTVKPPRDNNGNILPFSPLDLPELLTGVDTDITATNDSITVNNTTIPLDSATSVIAGTIDTSSSEAGGTINILGDKIALLGASLDASGSTGGTVLVGGDYQGEGTFFNASRTLVDAESSILANGEINGEGGTVILWSDEVTGFYGSISATGGEGFVEVSGKETLIFEGDVDVTGGTLLLDPENITISDNASSAGVDASLPDILQNDFVGEDVTIDKDQLLGLSDTSIQLEATNDIIIEDGINLSWDDAANISSITFKADSDFDGNGGFFMNSNNSITVEGGDINIEGATISAGSLNTTVTTGAGGNVTLSTKDHVSFGGNITFTSINTSPAEDIGGNVKIEANGLVLGTDTGITINASGWESGVVEITHDGGSDNVDFVVGGATVNGIAGKIEASSFSETNIITSQTFSMTENTSTQQVGETIFITSVNSPPSVSAFPALALESGETVTISYEDLSGYVSDVNNDNLTLNLDNITSLGKLTLNGVEITGQTGTISLNPGDVLEYIAPEQINSTINLFDLGGSDILSLSNREFYSATVSDIAPEIAPEPTPEPTPEPLVDLAVITDEFRLCPPNCSDENSSNEITVLDATETNFSDVINPVATLEAQYSQEYSDYWNQSFPEIPTLEDAQQTLQNIEQATGVKPVLFYAQFASQGGGDGQTTVKEARKDNSKGENGDFLELVLIQSEGTPVRIPLRNVTREEVLEKAGELRRNLTNLRRPGGFVAASQQLYEWLIAPAESVLKEWEIENIAFILDEGLRSVPIAALSNGEEFLIERYSVGLMPSLALTDTEYTPIQSSSVLAMGSQRFNTPEVQLEPLPSVPVELEIITQQAWKGTAYADEAFTEQRLLNARSQTPYGIVHLATHGEFQPGQLGNSYIAFQDHLLTLPEIRDLKFYSPQVNLLVLSACRTALGDPDAELGFAGLAVGSGAKSALGSLWYISDRGTLGFMSRFYEQLQDAPIKAEALRQTQLSILRGEVYFEDGFLVTPENRYPLPAELAELGNQDLRHPYFWSALTLIGSPW